MLPSGHLLTHVRSAAPQACLAYRAEGGRVIVVLSSRDKLEMEAMFRRTIPEDARCGSTFVFRQARPSPLPSPRARRLPAPGAQLSFVGGTVCLVG